LSVGVTGKQPTTPAECDVISLRGVRVHNLKGIDVDIPLGKLTVITGVSGSGKSSLAFDTLYAEGQRRYIETFAPAARQHLETLEKPDAESIGQIPPAIALRQNSVSRTRKATVSTVTEVNDLLRALLARSGTVVCPSCECEVVPQTPAGVVERLAELPEGQKFQIAFPFAIDAEVDVAEQLQQLTTSGYSRAVSVQRGLEMPSTANGTRAETCLLEDAIANGLPDSVNELLVIVDRLVAGRTTTERLTESVEACFLDGDGRCVALLPVEASGESEQQPQRISIDGQLWQLERFSQRRECSGCGTRFAEPDAALLSFRSPHGACPDCGGSGSVDEERCQTCFGSRLSLAARAVRLRPVGDELQPSTKTGSSAATWPGLSELEDATVEELSGKIERLSTQSTRAATRHLFDAILPRLRFLADAGLGYVELNRAMCDLSRGEAQRVALTSILSSQLVNSLFVLDEPSSGLHAADLTRVIDLLHRLRDQGNTVVVVEHEIDVAQAADHVIEIGPGSGASGGNVVFAGELDRLIEQPESATAKRYRETATSTPDVNAVSNATQTAGSVSLTGCRHHTLQNVSAEFPLGCLCVVAGVSGSGKTSLVEQTLYPALRRHLDAEAARESSNTPASATASVGGEFDELLVTGNLSGVELIDDRPLIASRRSSPVTWLKILAEIRSLFADTPDARNRNLTAAHFSFNTDAGGRCSKCSGTGFIEIDMQFMADVTMTCPDCHGTRFLPHILEVAWRNRSIADVLAMTADEAFAFFRGERRIQKKLVALRDVGLGYLPLGQPLSTLSGGEAQRLKLAGHLAATRGAGNLLILNEPTTGLHPEDVQTLLDCFRRLLTAGHSLIVIEHHRDVILAADHIIDLGPDAGPNGGRIVATGTPAEIQQSPDSVMGPWLRRVTDVQ
jgi:excinuclease ABC subunit A